MAEIETATPAAEESADQVQEWLESKGIDLDQSRQVQAVGADEEPDNAPLPAIIPDPPAEPRLTPQEAFQRREDARLSAENAQLRAYLDVLLMVANNDQQQAAASAEAEPEPDLFTEPDRWFEHRSAPLHERIAELEGQLRQTQGVQQDQQQGERAAQFVNIVHQAEQQWESQSPGYLSRLEEYGEAFRNDLILSGANPDAASAHWANELTSALTLAAQTGQNPAAFLDIKAQRYLGIDPAAGQQTTPSAPQRPQVPTGPPDPAIAAARRAQEGGATSSVVNGGRGDGGPALTIAAVQQRGIKPEEIREVYKQHGRSGFLDLMRRVERR
jgi:hypothetical protein